MNAQQELEKEINNIIDATQSKKISWQKLTYKDIYFISKNDKDQVIKVFIEKTSSYFPSDRVAQTYTYSFAIQVDDKVIMSKQGYELDNSKLLSDLYGVAKQRYDEEKEIHENEKQKQGIEILKKALLL